MLPASCRQLQAGSLRSPELLAPKLQAWERPWSWKLWLRSGKEHWLPALYSSDQSSTLTAMPSVSIREIADFVGGQPAGNGQRSITGVASLTEATPSQISFLSNRKYAADLAATRAGAILVPKNLEGDDERWIRVDDPYFAVAR